MSCPDPESLSAFVDGELDATTLTEIGQHISGCPSCRNVVADMRWLDGHGRSSLGSIRLKARPQSFMGSRGTQRRHLLLRFVPAAAAIILVSVTAFVIVPRRRIPQPLPTPNQATTSRTTDGTDALWPVWPTSDDPFGSLRGRARCVEAADVAFERWAEPYRQLRIPLIPTEQVVSYRPGEILPILSVHAAAPNNN
jgi:hypothetical protein